MLVHADGRFAGSVSGGCVEGDVLTLAAEVIARNRTTQRNYGVSDGAAWDFGLPCGGSIEILIQPVGDAGFPAALFDAIGNAGARGDILEIGTDLTTGRSRLAQTDEKALFINRYRPPRRLLIVGAVQIAQCLVEIVRPLDVRPVVIDPRCRFLTAERFPDVELDDRWPDDAITERRADAATAIVTLSHDPKIDDPALIAALAAPTGYIAALGSHRSHAARLARLLAGGVVSTELSRIEGPAGIEIGAIGAAEIALSIAAGMVAAFARSRL
jgi:xanthine dehydrogenase accessory factor